MGWLMTMLSVLVLSGRRVYFSGGKAKITNLIVQCPMERHPQIIQKEGKKEFVVLPYEEFLVLEEAMNDYEDLKDLREEKENSKNQLGVPLDKVDMYLGL
jgi:hypothetical protein